MRFGLEIFTREKSILNNLKKLGTQQSSNIFIWARLLMDLKAFLC